MRTIVAANMHLSWHLIGRAATFAGRVQVLQASDFQVGIDGASALPVKGDLLQLGVTDSGPQWFKCAGRRFDFSAADGPVLHIDLELG